MLTLFFQNKVNMLANLRESIRSKVSDAHGRHFFETVLDLIQGDRHAQNCHDEVEDEADDEQNEHGRRIARARREQQRESINIGDHIAPREQHLCTSAR